MTRCILGNQYMPSAAYFAHWMHYGLITLEAHEHYQKRSWRNKTAILGSNEPLLLTVPLEKGKHQQMKIRDVRIAHHEPWAKLHVTSIQTAYGKTAFFDEIRPGLHAILCAGFETLWDLNLNLLVFLTGMIRGTWDYKLSETFVRSYPHDVTDLRRGVPAGRLSADIKGGPEYLQVQRLSMEHLPNLSILDVLCHLGPETGDYLHRYADKLYETP